MSPQRVGVIGLGYVGRPLAVAFAEEGTDVGCLDTDTSKVTALRKGESYIEDVPSEVVERLAPRLRPTTRYADIATCDAVVIAVPTPLTRNRYADRASRSSESPSSLVSGTSASPQRS